MTRSSLGLRYPRGHLRAAAAHLQVQRWNSKHTIFKRCDVRQCFFVTLMMGMKQASCSQVFGLASTQSYTLQKGAHGQHLYDTQADTFTTHYTATPLLSMSGLLTGRPAAPLHPVLIYINCLVCCLLPPNSQRCGHVARTLGRNRGGGSPQHPLHPASNVGSVICSSQSEPR